MAVVGVACSCDDVLLPPLVHFMFNILLQSSLNGNVEFLETQFKEKLNYFVWAKVHVESFGTAHTGSTAHSHSWSQQQVFLGKVYSILHDVSALVKLSPLIVTRRRVIPSPGSACDCIGRYRNSLPVMSMCTLSHFLPLNTFQIHVVETSRFTHPSDRLDACYVSTPILTLTQLQGSAGFIDAAVKGHCLLSAAGGETQETSSKEPLTRPVFIDCFASWSTSWWSMFGWQCLQHR